MPEDKFQTAGGLKLHYLDFGGEGKPALVCIHGLTGNAHNFDGLVPHLTARYRVLALDVRGRGDSARGVPRPTTIRKSTSATSRNSSMRSG